MTAYGGRLGGHARRSTEAVNLSHKSFRFEGLCGPPAWETILAPGLRLAATACGCGGESGGDGQDGRSSKESRSLLPCSAMLCLELNSEDLQADRPAREEPPRWTRSPLRASLVLCGPSRLGESFFVECYCVVLHYRYARLCTAQAVPTSRLLFHDAR